MIRFTANDDELAFVVAHEMAHNNLKHSGRFGKGKLILAEFGIGSGKVRQAELAADELAIEMMASAGYDLDASESLLMRSGKHRGPNLSLSHPGTDRRLAGTRKARSHLVIRQTARSAPDPQPQHKAQAVIAFTLILLPPRLAAGDRQRPLGMAPSNPAKGRQHVNGMKSLTALSSTPATLALIEGLPR